ncbi:hypothetical protein FGIG_03627 [Fasciola gigantica]|uniref:Fibronectin type-III domain-containing protein n=1 Tax=Fasciola gigantica TaxID=46835 RepID=A0A504Z5B3_FASGI|nr:hypothetical protein FGIG_03627 [Fasciola gigantica]
MDRDATSTRFGACDKDYLCSAQLPPTKPRLLLSRWLSRHAALITWAQPGVLNGRLTGYRVIVSRFRWPEWTAPNKTGGRIESHLIKHFTRITEHQLNDMLPNSTYLIEVTAQTEATVSAGFGPPACLVLTTDECLDLSTDLHGATSLDCAVLGKRLQVFIGNLYRWYPLRAVDHTSRQLTLSADDSALLHAAHAQDEDPIDDDTPKTTSRASSVPEVTKQMIAAAYAQRAVASDSQSHVAIQFRLSAASSSQLGSPGPGSSWLLIAVDPPFVPVYRQWWFLVILSVCSTVSTVILLLLLRASISRHAHHPNLFFEKTASTSRSHDLMLDCCILNDSSCVDGGVATPVEQIKSPSGLTEGTRLNGKCVADGLNFMGAIPMNNSFYPVPDQQMDTRLDSSWGSRTVSNKTSSLAEVHLRHEGRSPLLLPESPIFSCTFPHFTENTGVEQAQNYPTQSVLEEVVQFDVPFSYSNMTESSHLIRAMDPTDHCSPIINPPFRKMSSSQALLEDPNQTAHFYLSPYQWSTCNPSSPAVNQSAQGYQTQKLPLTNPALDEATCFAIRPAAQAVPQWNQPSTQSINLSRGDQAVHREIGYRHHNPPNVVNLKCSLKDAPGLYMTPYSNPSPNPITHVSVSETHHPNIQAVISQPDWMTSSIHKNHEDLNLEFSPDLVKNALQNDLRCNAYIIDSDMNGLNTFPTQSYQDSSMYNLSHSPPDLVFRDSQHLDNNLGEPGNMGMNHDQQKSPCFLSPDALTSTEV